MVKVLDKFGDIIGYIDKDMSEITMTEYTETVRVKNKISFFDFLKGLFKKRNKNLN